MNRENGNHDGEQDAEVKPKTIYVSHTAPPSLPLRRYSVGVPGKLLLCGILASFCSLNHCDVSC